MNTQTTSAQQSPAKTPAKSYAKWLTLAAAVLGWMFDGLEMGIFPLVGKPALKEMLDGAPIGTWFGIIIAVFLVGAALGGVLMGWLGDRIGRTRAMIWSVLAYSIFSSLGAFVNEPWQLAGLRFLAALGMGGEWSLGVALVMETFPSTSRPLMAGIIGASANLGFLLIALLSFGLTSVIAGLTHSLGLVLPDSWVQSLVQNGSWRLLMILCALPALLTLFIRMFVPESEMWEKSSRTQKKKATLGDLFQGGLAKHTLIGAALGAIALLGTWGSVQWIPAWADKLSNKTPGVSAIVQMCSAFGAVVFSLSFALIAEKLNRRKAYTILATGSLIACGILFRIPMEYGRGFLVWTFLVGGITAGFYGWLPLYLPELFPTRVRAMGSGFAFNAGRIIAAGGTLVSGQLLNQFHEDYAKMCSIISLVYLIGIGLIWLAPETKGKALPE